MSLISNLDKFACKEFPLSRSNEINKGSETSDFVACSTDWDLFCADAHEGVKPQPTAAVSVNIVRNLDGVIMINPSNSPLYCGLQQRYLF